MAFLLATLKQCIQVVSYLTTPLAWLVRCLIQLAYSFCYASMSLYHTLSDSLSGSHSRHDHHEHDHNHSKDNNHHHSSAKPSHCSDHCSDSHDTHQTNFMVFLMESFSTSTVLQDYIASLETKESHDALDETIQKDMNWLIQQLHQQSPFNVIVNGRKISHQAYLSDYHKKAEEAIVAYIQSYIQPEHHNSQNAFLGFMGQCTASTPYEKHKGKKKTKRKNRSNKEG